MKKMKRLRAERLAGVHSLVINIEYVDMKKVDLNNKRAFTISEAAEYTCVSKATLHNWLVTGLLSYEELPGRGDGSHRFRLIRKCDLDAFLELGGHRYISLAGHDL